MSDFKNILWIEDDTTKRTEDFFGNLNSYTEKIGTLTEALNVIADKKETGCDDGDGYSFGDVLDEIIDMKKVCAKSEEVAAYTDRNFSEYDLAVFDLNLSSGVDIGSILTDDELYKTVAKKFEINGVTLPGYDEFDKFQKECGIYLYLLLLNKGFPTSRMVILTGNRRTAERLMEKYHLSTSAIIEKELVDPKDKNDKYKFNEKYYGKNSSFYAVRRLVFSAANYWEKILNGLKAEDIAFNKLYFKSEARYTKDDFIALLNEVKLLFENMVPSDEESVYYHAMHIFASFHEEKADIKKLYNKPNLYPYHSMIRFFRNWSAHNLFEDKKLSADEFALLFCITLRTYFDDCQTVEDKRKSAFCGKLLEYEKLYFNKTINNIKQQEYTKLAEKVLEQVSISISIKINSHSQQSVSLTKVLADKDIEGNAKLQNIFCLLIKCNSSFQIKYKTQNADESKITVNLYSKGIKGSECDKKFREVAAGLIAEILEREQKQKELTTV